MIEVRELSKRYGDRLAVDSISFDLDRGEVLGFLGPNGAGKTTTMRLLTGFLAPTSGTVRIGGERVDTESLATRALVGYLPEGAPLYGEMTVAGFLGFVADVRRLSGPRRRARLDEVVARLALGPVLGQAIATLSKGFRRRVGLAQAILHDPPVLILDEPTDGLDPNQKHEVRRLIDEMRSDKTLIVSTHILEEVHAVCSRAIIIADGRLCADATPAELERRSRYRGAVTVSFDAATDFDAARTALATLGDVAAVECDARERSVTLLPREGAALLPAVQDCIAGNRYGVAALALESGRLDEVFRQLTGGRDA
jgi:ABC-2 type transport system ATP-binding protein